MNRAAKYGDGLFETIRVANKKILFAKDHYQRLAKGFEVLDFRPITYQNFVAIIEKYINIKSEPNLRVRLTFFRLGEGLYTPKSSDWDYEVAISSLARGDYQLNSEGIHLGIAKKVRLATDQLANLKTISALPYVLAGIEKKRNNWDDCLILNHQDEIAESIAANVFWWADNTLHTPPLTAGCIAGIMRKQILGIATQNNIPTAEKKCTLASLAQAETVFLTNAIQGICWVEKIEGINRNYSAEMARQLIQELNKSLYVQDKK